MTLSEELTWRGFVNQTTLQDITILDEKKLKFYWGVDPSAASMQIGNLAAAMMARVFIKHGYMPVLLVGGATGLIGDPDGKAQERDLKSTDEVEKNKKSIIEQYKQVFKGAKFDVVDNYDWFKGLGYLDFLREIGKHVPLRQMLSRDFVQARIGEGGAGISYAEFSYSLIQGYDFLHLFEDKGVTLQLSGADQWGNSIAGVDLIRRKTGKEAHVWTLPLVVNKSTGKKFGKTEDGAVWLDSDLTSVYKFYQFWLNADDDGVEDYLKIYTDLTAPEVLKIMEDFNKDRSGRIAQKTLAHEVTRLVHGEDAERSVSKVTAVLFGSQEYNELSESDFVLLKQDLTSVIVSLESNYINSLVDAGLAGSNSEARRFIEQGAVYVNGKQIKIDDKISLTDFIDGKHSVIRRGKNSNAVLQLAD